MNSFEITGLALAPDAAAQSSVLQDLSHALESMRVAAATLSCLATDTEWEADGVRALHEELVRFQDSVTAQVGSLALRETECRQA